MPWMRRVPPPGWPPEFPAPGAVELELCIWCLVISPVLR
jgi:hypothetical protein